MTLHILKVHEGLGGHGKMRVGVSNLGTEKSTKKH